MNFKRSITHGAVTLGLTASSYLVYLFLKKQIGDAADSCYLPQNDEIGRIVRVGPFPVLSIRDNGETARQCPSIYAHELGHQERQHKYGWLVSVFRITRLGTFIDECMAWCRAAKRVRVKKVVMFASLATYFIGVVQEVLAWKWWLEKRREKKLKKAAKLAKGGDIHA